MPFPLIRSVTVDRYWPSLQRASSRQIDHSAGAFPEFASFLQPAGIWRWLRPGVNTERERKVLPGEEAEVLSLQEINGAPERKRPLVLLVVDLKQQFTIQRSIKVA